MQIKLLGIEQAVANLAQLPRRVAQRHLRIALNAAGGTVRDVAKSLAPRDSGALKSGLRVRVKIPDASWNIKHHGRPAYVVIGPARGIFKVVQISKGRARVISRKRLTTATALASRIRRPSRYAHLAERVKPFMGPASRTAGPAASARAVDKLVKGFLQEATLLPK